MKRKPVWPKPKRPPAFSSDAQEAAFWNKYAFEFLDAEEGWEKVPRSVVVEAFGLGLDQQELRKIRRLAKRRGVTVQKVIADLLHEAIAKAS
jgi:hypothetical protein